MLAPRIRDICSDRLNPMTSVPHRLWSVGFQAGFPGGSFFLDLVEFLELGEHLNGDGSGEEWMDSVALDFMNTLTTMKTDRHALRTSSNAVSWVKKTWGR